MSLFIRIQRDAQEAMKAAQSERSGTLRFLFAQLLAARKAKPLDQQDEALSDSEVLDLVAREVKKRREAIKLFREGNREDLASKEESEVVILQEYLPAMMTEDEIRILARELFESGAATFPALMKEMSARTKGRADGQTVARIVREIAP
jgi:hypothetical protein